MKMIDIKPRLPAVAIPVRKVLARKVLNFKKRSLLGFALTGLVLALVSLPLIFAFEAHVINVTATIHGCDEFEVRSRGFWKRHEELWILPQSVGPEYVETPEEAADILNYGGPDMARKLARELLALKFNIAYFGVGSAFVPGEDIRINDLAWEADQMLVQDALDPGSVTDQELEDMKDRVQKTNNATKVSTCKEPPKDPCDDEDDNRHHDLHGFTGGNGGDGGIIITGDACSEVEIENIVNINVTDIETCEGDCSENSTIEVENNNEAMVENYATSTAETGGNSANGGDATSTEEIELEQEPPAESPPEADIQAGPPQSEGLGGEPPPSESTSLPEESS